MMPHNTNVDIAMSNYMAISQNAKMCVKGTILQNQNIALSHHNVRLNW
jgi:hypothetical protein